MTDYSRRGQNVAAQDPFDAAVPVTPNNSVDLPNGVTSALWVGTGGNIKVTCLRMKDGVRTTAVIKGIPNGTLLQGRVIKVHQGSTTASDIVALY